MATGRKTETGGKEVMGNNDEERAREFLKCLGNGKSIFECEAENELIDDLFYSDTNLSRGDYK